MTIEIMASLVQSACLGASSASLAAPMHRRRYLMASLAAVQAPVSPSRLRAACRNTAARTPRSDRAKGTQWAHWAATKRGMLKSRRPLRQSPEV